MRKLLFACMALAVALCTTSCIISDSISTTTIEPDGSSEIVLFRSNIRSDHDEKKKREEEVAAYIRDFDARRGDPFDNVTRCGGEVLEARWIRDRFPYSNLVRATLPDGDALAKYLSFGKDEKELRVAASYASDGSRRKLTVRIMVPPDHKPPPPDPSDAETLRRGIANTVNEMRIITAGGRITRAVGFTPSEDRGSALLEGRAINQLLRAGDGAELILEWEITD